MENEHLKTLYKDIFEILYPKLKNEKRGVLYQAIHRLLEGEESKADEICTLLEIEDEASLDKDLDRINFLIHQKNALVFNPFNDQLLDKLDNVINQDMAKVAWILIIAFMVVGAFVCIKYRNNHKQNPEVNARKRQHDSLPSQPLPPITAALCLVVPASVIVDLRDKHPNALEDNLLDTPDLKMLIDNASYFLCTSVKEAKSKEQFLEMTNEEIPTNSSREVYIRIHIKSEPEIIGKESPYILKRNLPDYGQGNVQLYACLKNLSGLENFNRV